MTIVDLHPEHLLDREIRGELRDDERERLEAHLADCATCRLERQLRADFAQEMAEEGLTAGLPGLVERLAKEGTRRSERPAKRAPARRWQASVLAVVVALTVGVGALASTTSGRRLLAPWIGRSVAPSDGDTSPRPTPHARVHAPTGTVRAPEATGVASATSRGPESVPSTVDTISASTVTPIPPAPETAGALLQAESEARRRGDLAAVLAEHAQLVARFPATREAQVSRMMVARMLLDRGDAAGALTSFDAYLRSGGGELREDALAGRATALDRLGKTAEALDAWATLLDQYPGTAYATHARSRLEAAGDH